MQLLSQEKSHNIDINNKIKLHYQCTPIIRLLCCKAILYANKDIYNSMKLPSLFDTYKTQKKISSISKIISRPAPTQSPTTNPPTLQPTLSPTEQTVSSTTRPTTRTLRLVPQRRNMQVRKESLRQVRTLRTQRPIDQ